jgi:cytoskeletal protein CcmA (bactofilin family)
MSSELFAKNKPNDHPQEPASLVELLERPVDEIETILKDEASAPETGRATAELGSEGRSIMESEGRTVVSEVNAINKGSKLTGNLTISHDLEITGDVEGDITSEECSNIFIKGACKGNIRTKGSVEIEGDMSGGDIVAGGYVKLTGKFHGGKIQAKEKIHINGEFSGTLESNEIEVGSGAQGKGELFFKEDLSIQKGAKVEGRITRMEAERKPEAKQTEQKPQAARKEDAKPKKGFFH